MVELCFNTNFALTKTSMLGDGVKANFEMWLAMRGVIGGLPLMPLNLYSMSAVASLALVFIGLFSTPEMRLLPCKKGGLDGFIGAFI